MRYHWQLGSASGIHMNVGDGKVVLIHYTLHDAAGALLGSSDGGDPIAYLHGSGGIVRGLEQALTGKVAGDRVDVVVAPEMGYGLRDERLVQLIPRDRFPDPAALAAGQQFHADGPHGGRMLTVTRVEKDLVTVDANHPLAGKPLHFSVEVTEVRKATREELAHGHVHGPGGHKH
jgi:FKBP-type peptidyl-prolyl cis-trans isomerase SlyD